MSRHDPTNWEVLMLTLPCDYCDAKSGEWCLYRYGSVAPYLHSARHYRTRREVYE